MRALQRGGIPPLGFAALNPTYAVDLGRRVDNGATLSTNGGGAYPVENAARFSTLRQDIGWIAALGRSYGKRSRQARPLPLPLGEGWGEGAPAQRYPRSWASLRSTQPTRSISAVGWITAQPYPRMEPGLAQWKTLRGFPRYARTSAGSRPWAAPTGSGRARLDRPSPLGEGWGEGAPAPRYPLRWASLRSTQPTRPISAVVWITAQPYPRMEPGLPSGKRCAVFHATPGHRLDRGPGAAPTGSGRARLDRPSPLGEGWGEGAPAPRYPLRWASLRSTQPTQP